MKTAQLRTHMMDMTTKDTTTAHDEVHEIQDTIQAQPKLDSTSLANLKAKMDALEEELEAERLKYSINPLADASFDIQIGDKEYIVMKAIIFPWINILWLGVILMGIGTTMAVFYRIGSQKGKNEDPSSWFWKYFLPLLLEMEGPT
jgi:cytochrome c biogenesis factor